MRIAILGAAGGLGRNVVDAARAAGHDVAALVRDSQRDALPKSITTIVGDANRLDDVLRVTAGADAAVFCVMPSIRLWQTAFPPLLERAIEASRRTGARLIFPANVWIYGPGREGKIIDELHPPAPASQKGGLRAEMEHRLRNAGIRHTIVRLPEFYGPSVMTLTARIFRAALDNRRAIWPGPLDNGIELIYLPDAARALVEVAAAPGCDSSSFHISGAQTTARGFIDLVYRGAEREPRMFGAPRLLLSAAGLFDATVRAVGDIAHLWTHPILLDGRKFAQRFGAVPLTPLADGIAATLDWHRANPVAPLRN